MPAESPQKRARDASSSESGPTRKIPEAARPRPIADLCADAAERRRFAALLAKMSL